MVVTDANIVAVVIVIANVGVGVDVLGRSIYFDRDSAEKRDQDQKGLNKCSTLFLSPVFFNELVQFI